MIHTNKLAQERYAKKSVGTTATGGRPSVPLVTNAFGSDEDLPQRLKPKVSTATQPTTTAGSASATSPTRRRTPRLASWLTGLLPGRRRKTSNDDNQYMYISVVRQTPCRPTFIFDPSGRFCYYWSMVVSVAFLYNLWVISYRFSFNEITRETKWHWFIMDYSADAVYILDLLMGFRTGFFKDGVLVTSTKVIKERFMHSSHFYLGCLSLLPLDFLYLSLGYRSAVRCIRLVKIYRFWQYSERAERHSNSPNAFRVIILLHYLVLIFHWNACLLYAARDSFRMSVGREWSSNDTVYNYLNAYTVSCSALLLLQTDQLFTPVPKSKLPLLIVTAERMGGLFILAGVIGYVANVVNNLSLARKKFQGNIDSVKTYMRMRGVPSYLQMKVIRWFDYLWQSNRFSEDENVLHCLPDRLRAEVSIQVHLNTLKRVEIFRNTEPGFLCELVLRLSPLLFSPGDYVCRKGEVGKEMYVVNSGKLKVINDELGTVVATLTAGTYFGEISLLNLGNEGNRRTASVLSVGYSELLRLTKKDIWDVLEDYPTARERLEEIAHRRIEEVRTQAAQQAAQNAALQRQRIEVERSDERERRASAPDYLHQQAAARHALLQPISLRHASYDASSGTAKAAMRRRVSSRTTAVVSTEQQHTPMIEEEDAGSNSQPSTDVSPLSPCPRT